MKTLTLFISFFIFYSNIVNAQEEEIMAWKNLEFFLGWRGLSDNELIVFKMESQSILYNSSFNLIPNSINLVHQFPPSISIIDYVPNTVLTVNPFNSWLGFNFLTPPTDYDYSSLLKKPIYLESRFIPMETFYYGLYKINASIWNTDSDIIEKKGEFYMDFRDANYPGYVPPLPVIGAGTDFWIKYEGNAQPYFFCRAASPAQNDNNYNSLYEEPFEDLWTPISSGEVIPIWKLKLSNNDYVPSTASFQNYWQNCLALIPSSTGSKPRLVWGAHPTITVENYTIYRAVSPVPLSNPETTASLIATVSSSTFECTDNSILLGPVDYVYYFVKGKYRQGYLLTSRTNIVDTRGGLYKENTNEDIKIPDKLEITNYPNPFNPTTTINYTIPENGFTELKVYNIYGELVETPVSGNKEAGSYSVQFPTTGRELASGIYL